MAQAESSKVCSKFHLETSLGKEQLMKHIIGVIYGNCIGDAIGLLTEFMTKEEAKEVGIINSNTLLTRSF